MYDYCHLGHARAYVAFDLLKRVLTRQGYDVVHVQTTDIDDKIIDRANEQGEHPCLPNDLQQRATRT